MFIPLSSRGLLGTNRAQLHLKNLHSRNSSFQKLTEFSKGNNVLYAHAYNAEGFPWRETHVSSIQLNRPISKKESLSPP
jgi:hypothetical protein